jgi:ubiquinone/menaquinone biosynthesis C-methylase UbiE
MADDKRPKAGPVGWRDRRLDGWLNGATGELTAGLPVTEADTVIDVGCGDGALIHFCARQGAEVIFIDRNEAALNSTAAKIADSRARSYRAVLSDCDPIPLEDDIADLVICTEVLEHVPDPAAFLRELIRVARPGGRILITVPDARSELFVAATAPPQYFEKPNHIRVFAAEDFRELVRNAGLEIESHKFVGCFEGVYWPLAWLTCEPDSGLPLDNPHPITDHWTRLWKEVQDHPQGHKIRNALNELLPKSQSIVARKPA